MNHNMKNIVHAPNKTRLKKPIRVFLAGSIEMGTAGPWQDVVPEKISELNPVMFLNPRRPDWDSSWRQSISDPKFNEQVTWELENIECADVVFFYFDPETKSPISLMELGYALGRCVSEIIVCCPDGFWRQGNVDMICDRNGRRVHRDINAAIAELQDTINLLCNV